MVYLYPILLNLPLLPLKCSRYYLLFPGHFLKIYDTTFKMLNLTIVTYYEFL